MSIWLSRNHRPVDPLFILSSLLEKSNKKSLAFCFVDFRKVFDSVSHVKLWHKLEILGISGKTIEI